MKAGDIVIVKPRKPEWKNQPPKYLDEMTVYAGKKYKIERLSSFDGYVIFKGYAWSTEWLEPVGLLPEELFEI